MMANFTEISRVPLSFISSYFLDTTHFGRIQNMFNTIRNIKILYDNFLIFQASRAPTSPYNHDIVNSMLALINSQIINSL